MLWFMSIFSAWLTRQQVAENQTASRKIAYKRGNNGWLFLENMFLSNPDILFGKAIDHFDFFV